MAKRYTTDSLLTSVKTRVLIPTNQDTFTDANILMLADEELQTSLVPLIMSVQEEYFVDSKIYTLGSNVTSVEIPERAIGNKVKDITLLDSAGIERSLAQYSLEDSHDVRGTVSFPYGGSHGFYIEGNKIKLTFSSNTSNRLKVYFFSRPNSLILSTAAAQISAIDSSARTITVSSLPSSFLVGEEVDIVKNKAPYDNAAIDIEISSINGTDVILESWDSDIAVGQYLCLSGEAPVVQIPTELIPVLAQMVVMKITEALGDAKGVELARTRLMDMSEAALELISPRVEGERKIVTSRYNIMNYLSRRKNRWTF